MPADGVETSYGGGATLGLGTATGLVPVARRGANASDRLGVRLQRPDGRALDQTGT